MRVRGQIAWRGHAKARSVAEASCVSGTWPNITAIAALLTLGGACKSSDSEVRAGRFNGHRRGAAGTRRGAPARDGRRQGALVAPGATPREPLAPRGAARRARLSPRLRTPSFRSNGPPGPRPTRGPAWFTRGQGPLGPPTATACPAPRKPADRCCRRPGSRPWWAAE